MNWAGLVLGASLALCLLGATITAFAKKPRAAVAGLSAALLGVAGACLAIGNEYLAIVIAAVPGLLVPATMVLALHAAPAPDTDLRPRGRRGVFVAGILVLALLGIAWLATRTAWPPAGGTLQDGIEWLGTRLLTDHLLTVVLTAALLAASACAAIALLRGRTARR